MTILQDRISPPLAGGSTEKNITASWRHVKPIYRELISPCREVCAAGVRPELFVHHFAKGKVKDAFHEILKAHPFPAIMGRVCYKECEKKCNREEFDRAVAINTLERVTGDLAIDEGFDLGLPIRKNAGRAGIIGAGPAGLSFAYHMRKAGFEVTLFDMKNHPGGMVRFVIPGYRLPTKVVEAEIGRLLGDGIDYVKKLFTLKEVATTAEDFDVFLVATGAWQSSHPFQGQGNKSGMFDAISFLEMTKESPFTLKGMKVAVIGGGNSAIDSARAALRIGAHVDVYYRRDEKDMPAYEEEIQEALKEGVQFHFRHSPHSPLYDGDKLMGVKMTRTLVLRGKGAGPRGKVLTVEGSELEIPCDLLIFATGEEPAFSEKDVEINENLYLAGDAVDNAPRNVTSALGSGKEAALKFLKGAGFIDDQGEDEAYGEVAGADLIHRDYVRTALRLKVKVLPIERRIGSFEEVAKSPTLMEAMGEAERCLSCGECNGCDNCRIFCPDGAVKLKEGKYSVHNDHCKGCGICWTECPRGVITFMEG